MTRRADEHNRDDATEQCAPVVSDDAFLDALARAEDPSAGADPLAGLLLGLKREVDRPMPSAPDVSAVAPNASVAAPDSSATTPDASVAAPSFPDTAGEAAGGDVVSLAGERERRKARARRKSMNPWAAGLIGAAASAAIVAGTGAALYNATPDSPLWGPASAVFGDRTRAVELASTLDQLQVASEQGDTEHVNALLQQAQALIDAMNGPAATNRGGDDQAATSSRTLPTVTVTVTSTPGAGDAGAGRGSEVQVSTVVVPAPESPQQQRQPQPAQSGQQGEPASQQPAQSRQETKPTPQQEKKTAPQESPKTSAPQQPSSPSPQVVSPSNELSPQVQYGGESPSAADDATGPVPRVVTGSSN